MDAWAVVVLVLTVLVVITSIVRSIRRRRLLARLTPAERALHEQCVSADKSVTTARRAHDRAVKAAEKELDRARVPERLASAPGGHYVTPIGLRLNGNEHPLTKDVSALLDTTGTVVTNTVKRTSITRIAVGGLVAGPIGAVAGAAAQKTEERELDTRVHYLMVTGPDWQEVVTLGPEAGTEARSLMQAINVAAKNSAAARTRHAEAVEAAERELARVVADTAALDGAKATRAALGEDPLVRLKQLRKSGSRSHASESAPPVGPVLTGGVAGFDDPDGDGPQDTLR